MIKSLNELRGMRGDCATYEDLVIRCYDIADEIEREVEERYVERPVDADGMEIAHSDNMVDSNGERFMVSSIELLVSGEWILYGIGKLGSEYAKLCHHYKPPTVEDVLRVFASHVRNDAMKFERISDETIAEYAAKLQLREEE